MNAHDSERVAGPARGRRATRARPTARPLTSWCSTPAPSARTRTTGSTATSATCPRSRRRTRACRSPSAAAWRRRSGSRSSERAPWVDVVFGTHNIGSLPILLERARAAAGGAGRVRGVARRPSRRLLPTRRESAYSAWVSISVGCNNTCTFCIVPSLRGKEKDRRPGDILAEIRPLVDEGVIEVTLLGQNVNSYGVEFGDRQAFGKLLRACGQIEGLERVRFTSPHPRDFTDDVIEAMAETPNVMPQPAHAAAVRLGRDPEGDAPRLPPRPVPGILDHVRARDAARGHHHRHHRRLPGRDRGRLRRHARRGPAGPVRLRVHLPVLDPAGHAGRDDGRPGAGGSRAGPLRAARRAAGRDRLGGERELVGTEVEVLVAEGEGRKDAATTGCPAGRGTTGWCTSSPPATSRATRCPGRATSSPDHRRRAALPARRRRAARASAAPGPATPGRPTPAAARRRAAGQPGAAGARSGPARHAPRTLRRSADRRPLSGRR